MPEHYPHASASRKHEAKTPPRYSLAHSMIGSEDSLLRFVGGKTVRLVTYPRPTEDQATTRDTLMARGLIVGAMLPDSEDGTQVFRVPKSARPIEYDANEVGTGVFSYNDEQLFFDLGQLTSELFAADRRVVMTDIGRATAFVEFTEPEARQLFFVPGVERIIASLSYQSDPLSYYTELLKDSFGTRFDAANQYFEMGFREAQVPGA